MSMTQERLPSGYSNSAYQTGANTQPTLSSPTFYEAMGRNFWWGEEMIKPLRQYRTNWDSDNSPPPTAESMAVAAGLLAQIKALSQLKALSVVDDPEVDAVRDGGVSLEWENGSKYLNLEIGPNGSAVFLYKNPATNTRRCGQLVEFDNYMWALKLMFC